MKTLKLSREVFNTIDNIVSIDNQLAVIDGKSINTGGRALYHNNHIIFLDTFQRMAPSSQLKFLYYLGLENSTEIVYKHNGVTIYKIDERRNFDMFDGELNDDELVEIENYDELSCTEMRMVVAVVNGEFVHKLVCVDRGDNDSEILGKTFPGKVIQHYKMVSALDLPG